MQDKKTKKSVRIAAMAGVVILVLMYLTALICAFIDHPLATSLLWASLFCTFLIPVLIYLFQLCVRRFQPKEPPEA